MNHGTRVPRLKDITYQSRLGPFSNTGVVEPLLHYSTPLTRPWRWRRLLRNYLSNAEIRQLAAEGTRAIWTAYLHHHTMRSPHPYRTRRSA